MIGCSSSLKILLTDTRLFLLIFSTAGPIIVFGGIEDALTLVTGRILEVNGKSEAPTFGFGGTSSKFCVLYVS